MASVVRHHVVAAPAHASAEASGDGDARVRLSNGILSDLVALYSGPSALHTPASKSMGTLGLVDIGKAVGCSAEVLVPRRRATVLIIGNHSAGKSSFINYYVGKRVQPTGVAVESTGFTIIRDGTYDQTINGDGALLGNDHIRAAVDHLGAECRGHFVENLRLCVRTSNAHEFANVDLIDTPGLCDGEIRYPFDVMRCIEELAGVADLILVFLDPVGKAQVTLTMKTVDLLSRQLKYYDRMRFFLTKADTADTSQDLMKVGDQISINLGPHLFNTHGFSMPHMWIPSDNPADSEILEKRGFVADHNGLKYVLADIKETVNNKVQSNMTACKKACDTIAATITAAQVEERRRQVVIRQWQQYMWTLAPAFVIVGAMAFLDVLAASKDVMPAYVAGSEVVGALLAVAEPYVAGVVAVAAMFSLDAPRRHRLLAYAASFALISLLVQFLRCRTRRLGTRTPEQLKELMDHRAHVQRMRERVEELEREYTNAAQLPEYVARASSAPATFGAASAGSGSGSGSVSGFDVSAAPTARFARHRTLAAATPLSAGPHAPPFSLPDDVTATPVPATAAAAAAAAPVATPFAILRATTAPTPLPTAAHDLAAAAAAAAEVELPHDDDDGEESEAGGLLEEPDVATHKLASD